MAIFILLGVSLFAAVVSAVLPRNKQRFIEYIAVGATLLEAMLALVIGNAVLQGGTLYASAFFEADALGAFVVIFATLVSVAAATHAVGHLREEVRKGFIGFRRIKEHFILFHLFLFGMYLASMTTSPLFMWVAIEATTLATAFLITFYNKPSGLEAGWKYLIVNSVGILLGLLGTLLFLNAAAEAGAIFVSWSSFKDLAGSLDPLLIKIGFIFVVVGFGTKVGFVPMHTWLPDAHGKAPVSISSLLSGVLLSVALVAILRFRAVADTVLDPSFSQELLVGFGIASLVVAAFTIFGQRNYKRMLAYSSIEHMGIIALGFGVGGMGTIAALFHMFYHALLKSLLFLSAGNIFLKYGSTKITRVAGALTLVPTSAVVFFAALLAVAGTPPSGIFFTKLSILAAGMDAFPNIMMIALVTFIIVFAGFLRQAGKMLFSEAPKEVSKGEASLWTIISLGFLSVIFIALSIHIPEGLMELATRAAAIIQ